MTLTAPPVANRDARDPTAPTSHPAPHHAGAPECLCGLADCAERFRTYAAVLAATHPPGAGGPPEPVTDLRNELVERHLSLAQDLAARYRSGGIPMDDLLQVAALALVQAVDRFDTGRAVAFSAFAVPTVVGSLKRHFRDTRWVLHTPRRVQEVYLEVGHAVQQLTQRMGRAPAPADLAAHLRLDEAEVRDALRARHAHPLSLDAPVAGPEGPEEALGAALGRTDPGYELVEHRIDLKPLLATLPQRELRVIAMRFFDSMTQAQIAQRLNCSQAHVSRLLARALATLRRELDGARTGQPADRPVRSGQAARCLPVPGDAAPVREVPAARRWE